VTKIKEYAKGKCKKVKVGLKEWFINNIKKKLKKK
jgi:hypothetical protein